MCWRDGELVYLTTKWFTGNFKKNWNSISYNSCIWRTVGKQLSDQGYRLRWETAFLCWFWYSPVQCISKANNFMCCLFAITNAIAHYEKTLKAVCKHILNTYLSKPVINKWNFPENRHHQTSFFFELPCQLGKDQYLMVRRLLNRFIGECSGYFSCFCVVY